MDGNKKCGIFSDVFILRYPPRAGGRRSNVQGERYNVQGERYCVQGESSNVHVKVYCAGQFYNVNDPSHRG